MPKKCTAVGCRSGYAPKIKKRKHEETETSDAKIGDKETSEAAAENKVPVFGFPGAIKKPGLRKKWINFVKREDWVHIQVFAGNILIPNILEMEGKEAH